MIVIDKSLGEVNSESYLIKNAKDNTYLLTLPNNLNGYNYFEVYIDKLNRSIHVFDSLGVASGKCGFTTLRAFSPLIPRVYRLL
ncbi:hypothetical protein BUL45_11610 [Clostridium perfringens]|nr:hypothetical protein [Clostridium perfringens]